jgi:hypothetical protein
VTIICPAVIVHCTYATIRLSSVSSSVHILARMASLYTLLGGTCNSYRDGIVQNKTVASLQLCIQHRKPMGFVTEARAIAELGLEGDLHARRGSKRQILLMDIETLKEFELQPGMVRENITVKGMDLSVLQPGAVLRIGQEVVLEVTGDCEPCERMDELQLGLQQALQGRRGILTVVRRGGILRFGDGISMDG